ncbi:MAG: AmmeMemoRadiSam system radical SAM enzyme [Elusimicrobia bacterium]|nr:AmmeMemoRadiSam system radical SAM enzyme [Elusimicrobiota bacterium]MBD3411561.1 AmmeMemoRadiSam system radical SAM enzyme [Elusimicrobiota bacterium]
MNKIVECSLCPHRCRIEPGHSGDCRVRINHDGRLIASVFGRAASVHVDPMEKKPLYHFLPGKPIFSISTAGCNLHCQHCQNWEISQKTGYELQSYLAQPADVVAYAQENSCLAIAYTYNDPVVYYEYVLETARIAQGKNIKNVLVTAGYINEKPLRQWAPYIDASNTDLKSFNDEFYRTICGATLQPVLDALRIQREEGIWVEVTNLIIPTQNDDLAMIKKMCVWIRDNLGDYTPLHFSRFFPHYKARNLPPTPVDTLMKARMIAMDVGLKYVYVGNLLAKGTGNTLCSHCGKVAIGRVGYQITEYNINDNGICKFCNSKIEGVFKP